MRTFRFHPLFAPDGRIFDTTGVTAERPPTAPGWVEHFGEQDMTVQQYTDKVVEMAVKAQLKEQGPHRGELVGEHEKKYGTTPHTLATNDEVANVMDNKTTDGNTRIYVPGQLKRRK